MDCCIILMYRKYVLYDMITYKDMSHPKRCELYIILCMYRIWNVCTEYGMCVQNMECVYRIWNVCTEYGMCVQNMECVYIIWNVCT